MNSDTPERFLEKLNSYIVGVREIRAFVDPLRRHEDNMTAWIISMAAGAVVAVPTALGYIVDLRALPKWPLATTLGFFVLAVLSGILRRLILAKLSEEDAQFLFEKIYALETLKLEAIDGPEEVDRWRKELLKIMGNEIGGLSQRKEKIDSLSRWGGRVVHLPYVLFGLGILAAWAMAIFGSHKPSLDY